ncbi:MAG: hypothetical protein PHP09_03375 [Bacilli bacterium]|nr:hypothetical protein [Bacilli bacterium]MDD4344960.1 hypothetical protein [Bacilli bacterium]MDD4521323.1 hypothetical protein [Bacilli bacterium]
MKAKKVSPFEVYLTNLPEAEQFKLTAYFLELSKRIVLPPKEKRKIIRDFEQVVQYYLDAGIPVDLALQRLDLANLGGFYARPATRWFALDYAAKIYPLSLAHGQISLFRLSVYLKAPVQPEILQIALTFTIKRFPQFATTLKKGFFWHYLDSTKGHYPVMEEVERPLYPIRVSLSGSKTFKVLYFQNRISVEIFHALTDGSGGMVFLKTLIREYFRLLGLEAPLDETTFDINCAPDSAEDNNEFENAPKGPASGFINKKSLQLSGALSRIKPCQIIHFKMSLPRLKEVSKAYGTTITGYISAQMLVADKYATETSSGDLTVQVPVNMRKFYPSKTIRNFSMYFGVRLPIDKVTSTKEIIPLVHQQLVANSSPEKMTEMLYSTKQMVRKLRFIPLFIKTPIAKRVYGMIGERSYTNTLSNLGIVNFPSQLGEHIESLDFILGTAVVNRANVSVVTFKDTVTLSISKNTTDNAFEERLLALFNIDEIPLTIEGSDVYENAQYVPTRQKAKTRKK